MTVAPLVARGGALGDFVLTLPLLAALRAHHGRPVRLLADPGHGALAVDAGLARESWRLDEPRLSALWSGGDLEPVRALLGPIGAAYVLRPVDEGPITRRLQSLGAVAVTVLDPRPPPDGTRHAADHLLRALPPGAPPVPPENLCLPAARRARGAGAPGRPPGRGRRWVVVAPGAGGEAKRWPLHLFRSLARRLERRGIFVSWLLGPVEAERGRVGAPGPCLPLAGPSMTAALLAGADLLVGNDTGTSHLAAAAGVPVLALFGPTDPRTWAPRGGRVRILSAPRLEALTVDMVASAALAAISPPGENAPDPP